VACFSTLIENGVSPLEAYAEITSYDKWERVAFKLTPQEDGLYMLALQFMGNASSGYTHDVRFKNIKVTTDTTDTTFSPYHKTTFAIPAAVQALDGYGWGISDKVHNGIEWDENGKPVYVKRVSRVVYNGAEPWALSSYQNSPQFGNSANCKDKKSNGGVLCNKYKIGVPNGGLPCMSNTPSPLVYYPEGIDTIEGWKAQLAQWAAEGDPLVTYYELAEPIVTDISAYFTEDNLIPVEGGGTITAVNEHGLAATTTIVYQKRGV
jgi:hypothetical protein